jgi:hypothetical protein
MTRQQLLSDAKNFVFYLKKEERRSINPYASFADQVIGLLNNDQVSSREEILNYTRISYSRPRMNRQWRTFGNVLEKNLRSNIKKDELLNFFGYLKRLLTIEGKKEFEEKREFRHKGYGSQYKRQHRNRRK